MCTIQQIQTDRLVYQPDYESLEKDDLIKIIQRLEKLLPVRREVVAATHVK